MSLAPVLAWLGVLGFAAVSFFFALAETALFSLGKWRARQLAERSPSLGGCVASLLDEPQDLLATIVLGNTLANPRSSRSRCGLPERDGASGLTLVGTFRHPAGLRGGAQDAGGGCRRRGAARGGADDFPRGRSRPLRQVAQRLNEALLRVAIPNPSSRTPR